MNSLLRSDRLCKFRKGFLLLGIISLLAVVPSLIGRPAKLSVNRAKPGPLQMGGSFEIKPSVIAGGGGTSTNGTTRLDGTIGQSVLGTSSGGTFSVLGGFWQGAQQPGVSIAIDGTIRYYSLAVAPTQGPPPAAQPPINCLDTSFDAAKPVPGSTVQVTSGTPTGTSTPSDAAGFYSVTGLGAGPYTLAPGKPSPTPPPPPPPGISSLDATRIQNFLVGLLSLNECQRLAADTTNNGLISSLDATRIQQYLTSISNPGITGTWKFVQPSKTYITLVADQHNENYNGVLVGDVNGNLVPTSPNGPTSITAAPIASQAHSNGIQSPTVAIVPIFFGNRFAAPGQVSLLVPINVTNLPANNSTDNLLAYDLVITFNPAVLRPNPATGQGANSIAGTLSNTSGASVLTNLPGGLGTGTMTISGSLPNSTTNTSTASGVLLNLIFDVIGGAGTSSAMNFTFTSLEGNGLITPQPTNGTVTVGPTVVAFQGAKASSYENGTFVEWRTGFEAESLGFNVYREDGGNRTRVNHEVIAGSALRVGSATKLQAGQSYAWWDNTADSQPNARYWIEEVDLNGLRTMHGPFGARRVGGKPPRESDAELLSHVGRGEPSVHQVPLADELSRADAVHADVSTMAATPKLSAMPALKMTVREEGFYRVTQQEMVAAGFNTNTNPRNLRLFLNGVEHPMRVVGEQDGRLDAIEFLGTGRDTAATDAHVYWLVGGDEPGSRIGIVKGEPKSGGAKSFPFTVERRDRTVYFSSLRNGDEENFFGQVVTSKPVDQTLTLRNVDSTSSGQAEVEVALQGVTDLTRHSVRVQLNGLQLGTLVFDGQTRKVQKFTISSEATKEGDNVVTLAAEVADSDVSLVDYIRITYPHSYAGEQDSLRMTVAPGPLTIEGFTNGTVRVFDITDAATAVELAGKVVAQGSGYAVTVDVTGQGTRTLLALADNRIKAPAAIALNEPSNWRSKKNRADLVIIGRGEFFGALEPLRALRESQGLRVQMVDIADIFDEFSDAERSPQAVKDFLLNAATTWKRKPGFVLFAGHASLDPRNHLGFGDSDIVPTKLLDTGLMETASDDWFADFNNDGLPELAVGRLPFRTQSEAVTMVSKIVAYDASRPSNGALLVADENDGFDFEAASGQVRNTLPTGLFVNRINRGRVEVDVAKKALINLVNQGQKIVNYIGHGSVNQWKGNLLTNDDARAFTNSSNLSLFVVMTCLNGYFQDAAFDSLSEALLKAERGGAVAVWASSGMTGPADQSAINQELYRQLFGSPSQGITLGQAAVKAKAATADPDVRRTWVLLGDPSMRIK